MRKSVSIAAFISLAMIVVARSQEQEIITVEPKDAEAIRWEGKTGQTIDGLAIKDDVSILLWKCTDIVIETCELRSIELEECKRIIIRNCWIHHSSHCGVAISKSEEISVVGCRLEKVASGVYAVLSKDIRVEGNFSSNVYGPKPRGQFVQFDKVTGRYNGIRNNFAINEYFESKSEDAISLFARLCLKTEF